MSIILIHFNSTIQLIAWISQMQNFSYIFKCLLFLNEGNLCEGEMDTFFLCMVFILWEGKF